MGILIWTHWIWEAGILFLIGCAICYRFFDTPAKFKSAWEDGGIIIGVAIISIGGLLFSYACLLSIACVNKEDTPDLNEIKRVIDKYGSYEKMHEYYKDCWWSGMKILIIIIIIVLLIGGIFIMKGMKKRKFEKQLQKIKVSIEAIRKQKKETDDNEAWKELNRMEKVLNEAYNNVTRQATMEEVDRGIRAIREIQRDYEFIDVQREIDELDALNKLGW